MPKKKPAKKRTTKGAKKKPAKKSAKKTTKRATKRPKHHLESAHRALMRAVPHVTREDLDALKRIESALSHGTTNARSSR